MDRTGIFLTVSSKQFDQYHRIKETLQEPIDPSRNGQQELEVGLIQITYPNTWYIFDDESRFDVWVTVVYADSASGALIRGELKTNIVLQNITDNLDLEQDFLQSINNTVSAGITKSIDRFLLSKKLPRGLLADVHARGDDYWNISYERNTRRVEISDPFRLRRVHGGSTRFGNFQGLRLWRLLCFDQFTNTSTHRLPITSVREPTVASQTTIMNIYTPNLIRDQRVGDTFSPLLEIVPVLVKDINAKTVTYRQSRPVYKRLLRGYINEVTIEIRDHNDLLIPLESGQFRITLHIRPCRRWQFQSPQLMNNSGEG